MQTKGDILDIINNKIDNYIEILKKNNNNYFVFKRNGSFFRKKTLGDNSYVSDIDTTIYVKNNNINDTTTFFQNGIKYFCESNNFYMMEIKAGYDYRFDFGFIINKNGISYNYNAVDIRNSLNNLYADLIITKKELEEILEYVKDNPTFLEINTLYNYLKKYKNLFWTCDDIKNGKLEYRKKTFNFIDIVKNFVVIVRTVLEFEEGKYIIYETGFVSYTIKNEHKNTNLSIYSNNIVIKKYSDFALNQTKNLYYEVFKLYIRKRYFKLLKRLRSLLNFELFPKNSGDIYTKKLRDKKNKNKILNVINKIDKLILNTELRCLSQIKEQIDIIIVLLKYKNELEIKRLLVNLLKNSITFCNYDIETNIVNGYNLLNKKYNKDKIEILLEKYGNSIQNKINILIYPDLVEIYNDINYLLPFKLSLS